MNMLLRYDLTCRCSPSPCWRKMHKLCQVLAKLNGHKSFNLQLSSWVCADLRISLMEAQYSDTVTPVISWTSSPANFAVPKPDLPEGGVFHPRRYSNQSKLCDSIKENNVALCTIVGAPYYSWFQSECSLCGRGRAEDDMLASLDITFAYEGL